MCVYNNGSGTGKLSPSLLSRSILFKLPRAGMEAKVYASTHARSMILYACMHSKHEYTHPYSELGTLFFPLLLRVQQYSPSTRRNSPYCALTLRLCWKHIDRKLRCICALTSGKLEYHQTAVIPLSSQTDDGLHVGGASVPWAAGKQVPIRAV